MIRVRIIRTGIGLIPLALGACGIGEDQEGPAFAVRDSAGIQIVENTAPAWNEAQGWRLSAEPLLQIGEVEGAPAYQFSRVPAVLQLSDGRIAVANSGSHEIRLFDASGRHLRSVGGKGGGPGEFESLSWIRRLPGDSLLAYDERQRRLSTFDSQGALVRSSNLVFSKDAEFPRAVGRFSNGALLIWTGGVYVAGEVKDGPSRAPVSLSRYSAEGTPMDPIAALLGPETFVQTEEGGFTVTLLPFGRASRHALAGDRVFAGDNDTYSIGVYSADGKLERLIRRQHTPHPVTQEHIDMVRQERLDGTDSPGSRQRIEKMIAAMPLPPTMPAFDALQADDDAHLWVREYSPPGTLGSQWTVFDREGRMLGTVSMPDHFRPTQIGRDFVLGVWRDDLDVEHVQMYALEKPA
jgi:hypothetical protein